jgi:hypothetical protein
MADDANLDAHSVIADPATFMFDLQKLVSTSWQKFWLEDVQAEKHICPSDLMSTVRAQSPVVNNWSVVGTHHRIYTVIRTPHFPFELPAFMGCASIKGPRQLFLDPASKEVRGSLMEWLCDFTAAMNSESSFNNRGGH